METELKIKINKQEQFRLFEELTVLLLNKTLDTDKFPELIKLRESMQKLADKGEI